MTDRTQTGSAAVRRASLLFFGAVALLCLSSGAIAFADVIVPSSAFSSGANSSLFQSDVRLFNPSPVAITVTPVFYNQRPNPKVTLTGSPIAIPARSQVAFDNILATVFSRTVDERAFGPIRFVTTAPLVVSSSINNTNACLTGAVSGQWLPGLDPVAFALIAGTLPQLAASASSTEGYRTNLTFVNPSSDTEARVATDVRKGDGSILSTAMITLAANGALQVSMTDGNTFPGVAGTTDTNLYVSFTSNIPVLVTASVNSNTSGDSFAIVANPEPTARPVASFTVSASPKVGSPVTFTDTSTGFPALQLWDFGDGTTALGGKTATKTYTAAGTYRVVHFVSNASGPSAATQNVVVTAAGPESITITATTTNNTLWTFTPNNVTLDVGKTYQIKFQSNDDLHGVGGLALLGITQCNLISPVLPCNVTITPTANQVGMYDYFCTQNSCGAGHSTMGGHIVVRNP